MTSWRLHLNKAKLPTVTVESYIFFKIDFALLSFNLQKLTRIWGILSAGSVSINLRSLIKVFYWISTNHVVPNRIPMICVW